MTSPRGAGARAVRETAIDAAIAAIADSQQGIVSRKQLLALGLKPGAIQYRIAIGRLHPLHSGVYAVGHRPISPHGHAYAAVAACGPGSALSHGSAATLWGIANEWRWPLEVTTRSRRRHRRIHVHCSKVLTECDITVHYGIPVTTPALTLLDNADGLSDARLGRAINDLRLRNHLRLSELSELLTRCPQSHAAKRLRPHVAHPERAPTRSELEDTFLSFARAYGFPEPEVNTSIGGYEADIFFPAHRLVIELDSYLHHSGREQFERDRDRDADRLAAEIATVRVTWERINLEPAREAKRLLAIIARRAPGA